MKLVKAEMIISHLSPIAGSINAPDKLLDIRARLLTLHNNAKDVASRPGMDFLAIKSITMTKINIPRKL